MNNFILPAIITGFLFSFNPACSMEKEELDKEFKWTSYKSDGVVNSKKAVNLYGFVYDFGTELPTSNQRTSALMNKVCSEQSTTEERKNASLALAYCYKNAGKREAYIEFLKMSVQYKNQYAELDLMTELLSNGNIEEAKSLAAQLHQRLEGANEIKELTTEQKKKALLKFEDVIKKEEVNLKYREITLLNKN